MGKSFILLLSIFYATSTFSQDVQQLRETARTFQQQGDNENAILVLNKAVSMDPANPDVLKELGIAYYVARQYQKSLDIIKPLLERPDADEQIFQLTSLAYRGLLNLKEAEKTYKSGLKKFPNSGVLYAEYGDLLEVANPGLGKGIELWEKGIEADPAFPANYYQAAKFYLNNGAGIWGLLYAEVFVNLESYTGRTTEIKNLLLAGYKKLFAFGIAAEKSKNAFETNFLESLKKQTSLVGNGVTAEALTALRTRFEIEWHDNHSQKFPFQLFNLHRQLLQEGLFEAYNQWLFGSVDNITAYQAWTANHNADYNAFNKYQHNKVFTVPAGQYYNK
jgi:tetratricopeptide (TPR) repeat protein